MERIRNIEQVEEFNHFMRRDDLSVNERLLIHAVAALSVQDPYTSKTPEEIWDFLREQLVAVEKMGAAS